MLPKTIKMRKSKINSDIRLQSILGKLKEKEMTILMGNLNAKIGADNCGYEEVMGRHSLGKMNENGEMFTDLCASNRLVIGGRVFPHRRIHKATWISPDRRSENQIDHVRIGRILRRSLLDFRVYRGADAAPDHHRVLAKIKLKLKGVWVIRSTRSCYNVGFLKDRDVLDKYSRTYWKMKAQTYRTIGSYQRRLGLTLVRMYLVGESCSSGSGFLVRHYRKCRKDGKERVV